MPTTLDVQAAVIQKRLRVPVAAPTPGDGAAAARQLDVALLSVGFTCSPELFGALSKAHPAEVRQIGQATLRAVRALVGDHVDHNAYFIDFPAGVPDTQAFWAQCLGNALIDHRSRDTVVQSLIRGVVNLLDLPRYGRYQHTYEEMLARHEHLVESAKDRITVLDLGGPLAEESHALYLELATSEIPLYAEDLAILAVLADAHVADAEPTEIPMRESRAVVNAARLGHGIAPEVDTVTDVLRLACALSGGDVTLTEPTRFRSFRRSERRVLLGALDDVVARDPGKLIDVRRHPEPFKRLGERLHPHDYPRFTGASDAFAVARGDRPARSLAGRVDAAIDSGDVDEALRLLAAAPGALLRSTDRLAREGADPDVLVAAVADAAGQASLRVTLQLREQLLGRGTPDHARVFVNQSGRAWAAPDERPPLSPTLRADLGATLDAAVTARLPRVRDLVVVDPGARGVALPLTGKHRPDGLGLLPRGSRTPVDGSLLRFFVHWKQRRERTDYDLSVLLLDADFRGTGQVSWTNLSEIGAVHSGDLTEAPNGASEFIEIELQTVDATYVVPQVHIYSGERFDVAEEAYFGFMRREPGQAGAPFEPRTVRAKSDLSGNARVTLPLLFARTESGTWEAIWLHLALRGNPRFNRVEDHHRSTSVLVRGMAERAHLTLGYIEQLLAERGAEVVESSSGLDPAVPVTYLGAAAPHDLPAGSNVISPSTFWSWLD